MNPDFNKIILVGLFLIGLLIISFFAQIKKILVISLIQRLELVLLVELVWRDVLWKVQ